MLRKVSNLKRPSILTSQISAPLEYNTGFSANSGTAYVAIRYKFQTRMMTGHQSPDLMLYPAQDYNNTRQFIKLDQAFRTQLKEYAEAFHGKTQFELMELMKLSSNILLKILPDKISLQLTEEGCIFYTLIKNNLRIFFSHYLLASLQDLDEAIITIYEQDNNLLNYAGELWQTVQAANKVLHSFNITIPEFV